MVENRVADITQESIEFMTEWLDYKIKSRPDGESIIFYNEEGREIRTLGELRELMKKKDYSDGLEFAYDVNNDSDWFI